MLPPATITDRDSLSASSPHHARTRRSAPLYSRKLALLFFAFALALLSVPPSLNAQTLPAPQNVQVSSTGLITWDAVEGATHYALSSFDTVDSSWRYMLDGYVLPASVRSFQMTTDLHSDVDRVRVKATSDPIAKAATAAA